MVAAWSIRRLPNFDQAAAWSIRRCLILIRQQHDWSGCGLILIRQRMLHTSPWTSDAPHQSLDAKKIAWGGDKVSHNTRTSRLLERIGLRADSLKRTHFVNYTILVLILPQKYFNSVENPFQRKRIFRDLGVKLSDKWNYAYWKLDITMEDINFANIFSFSLN